MQQLSKIGMKSEHLQVAAKDSGEEKNQLVATVTIIRKKIIYE